MSFLMRLIPRTPFEWFISLLLLLSAAIVFVAIGRQMENDGQSLHYQPPSSVNALVDGSGSTSLVVSETVYVPVYSHIFQHNGSPFLLAATVSVRSTDPKRSIVVTSARYFDTTGKEVRNFVNKPLTLGPLASVAFFVEQSDTAGGPGASFLIDWAASEPVTEPVVESVMLGTVGSTQAVSFARPGKVVRKQNESETFVVPAEKNGTAP